MMKTYKTIKTFVVMLVLFSAISGKAQTLVPFSGSNTVNCGYNGTLEDHAGSGLYSNNADGYTVLLSGAQAVINLSGAYQVENGFDYIYIYDGIGTGGTLLQTYNGTGNANFTSQPGQTITVRFDTDGSVTQSGFNFSVTTTGACVSVPCAGIPPSNTVIAGPSSLICPGSAVDLSLASNNYTAAAGYTFQWQSSTFSAFGPFVSIPNATAIAYTANNVSANTWYQAVITCTAGGTTSASAAGVSVQPVTISTVPYYESFENMFYNSSLTQLMPNCSWSASSGGGATLTYTTSNTLGRIPSQGTSFASFFQTPSGLKSFYSNGITMQTGITYSASLRWITDQSNVNWTDLSILINNTQSATGAQTVASTPGPAVSPIYTTLGGTFSISSPGTYYVGVLATSTLTGAPYLSWDELRISIPCELNGPSMTVTGPSVACTGQPLNLIASGANSYTWNTGATGAAVSLTPGITTTGYTVTGTNALTGCSASVYKAVQVEVTPEVSIVADKTEVCGSQPVKLIATGANTYNWSHGPSTAFTTVTPTASTTYSVLGFSQGGCAVMVTQAITVNSIPNVAASSDINNICVGQQVVLTGSGANSYQWVSSNSELFIGNPISITPQSSAVYTVTGTDANGCKNTAKIIVDVNECTAINELTGNGGLSVFPNPNNGKFTVSAGALSVTSVEVIDVAGRIVSKSLASSNSEFDISGLANGVYYVKVITSQDVKIVKMIKE